MFNALLIDDNLGFRTALHEALRSRFPFCNLVVLDGMASALESVASLRADVIVMDLMLRDGSGLELIRRLRAMRIAAPIVVLTIHDLPEYRDEAVRSGADQYFAKLTTSAPDIFRYFDGLLGRRLRALIVCGDPALNELIAALFDARRPDVVLARAFALEEGVKMGRLLKPQLVIFDCDDDREREGLYCHRLGVACRDSEPRLACVRAAVGDGVGPAGADFVLSRSGPLEHELVRIVDLVRGERFPLQAAT